MIWTRYLLCFILGYVVFVAAAYQASSEEYQYVKRLPEYDPQYYPSSLWELDNAVRLKKWASQLRFGKRSGNSWASQIYSHEKWFFSMEDYETWLKAFGPEDFNLIVAIDTKLNKVIGSVAVAKYPGADGSESLVALGLYFVHPDHRKKGLGNELFRMAFKDSHFVGINRGLVAVESMVAKYCNAYGYDKISSGKAVTARALVSDLQLTNLFIDEKIQVLSLQEASRLIDFENLVHFDMENNGGLNRGKYLNAWLAAPNSISSQIAFDENGEIVGYINIRTSIGNDIGVSPLIAKSPEIASTLLRRGLEEVHDLEQYRQIFFFSLTDNHTARKIYVKLTVGTLIPVATCTPMYTEKLLPTKSENVFSVTEYTMCTI
ncbi:hypothetical protein FO519_006386 [Halicephalobus sp. NKZ332]|nr:hypothetical protein FO519_006386 [Halicephalobus sp. NKZ332]